MSAQGIDGHMINVHYYYYCWVEVRRSLVEASRLLCFTFTCRGHQLQQIKTPMKFMGRAACVNRLNQGLFYSTNYSLV